MYLGSAPISPSTRLIEHPQRPRLDGLMEPLGPVAARLTEVHVPAVPLPAGGLGEDIGVPVAVRLPLSAYIGVPEALLAGDGRRERPDARLESHRRYHRAGFPAFAQASSVRARTTSPPPASWPAVHGACEAHEALWRMADGNSPRTPRSGY